jgi:hypothetical protein
MSSNTGNFKELIQDKIGADAYKVPVEREDCIVLLARLKPMTDSDKTLKMAESRALMFIEDALKLSIKSKKWDIRFSRPWVLKKDKIAYTWDFTIQGDIPEALDALSTIKTMSIPQSRSEEVYVQTSKPKRGVVKQVSVGAIR